jgi:hypothetical protein
VVAAEKIIVKFDLEWHANSKNMKSSLKTAKEELEAIETNIGLVGDQPNFSCRNVGVRYAYPNLRLCPLSSAS